MIDQSDGTATTGFEIHSLARTAGAALRKEREARGLSIGDVVQVLKFNPRQIEALETNNLAALPGGPAFVRGVVRSYARFLNINAEPLLQLLANDAQGLEPDVRPPDNMGTAMPRGGFRRLQPLVILAILLLLASGGLLGWYYMGLPLPTLFDRHHEPSVEAAASAASADKASVASTATKPSEAKPESKPEVKDTAGKELVAKEVNAKEPVAAVAAVTTAPPVVAPGPDAKKLQFRFKGKSWVEVKDSTQQIIFTGQFTEGSREVISDKPPFQLVVGNPNRVEVIYGERHVDLKKHTRAEVARLSLD